MKNKILKMGQKIAMRINEPIDRLANWSYHNYPFGNTPRGNIEYYKNTWLEAMQKKYAVVDQYTKKTGYEIDLTWFHELALHTQVVKKRSEICYQHGRLLYATLSAYMAENSHHNINILETGTARGFSSLCMARALQDAGRAGKIFTFDVLPHETKMYWNCIDDEMGPQTRKQLINKYESLIDNYIIFIQGDSKIQLKKIDISRIHFAFLDGAHTYEHVMSEFNFLRSKQLQKDVIFFDDYTPDNFPGVVKAVDKLCFENNYTKEVITLNKNRGYVIARKK